MDAELRNILRETAKEGTNDSYTHVTLCGQQMKWHIAPDDQTKFWIDYCDLVHRKVTKALEDDPPANLCIAERPLSIMPQIAELMFKFDLSDDIPGDHWEPYDDDFLKYLCHTYQTVLADNFKTSIETQMELVVVVLESSSWYEENKETGQKIMIIELRLHFPYARIDIGLQNKLIRTKVIQLLHKNNILSKMQRQPIGDWKEIISSTTTRNPVVMFGSSKELDRPKLEIIHIWPYVDEDILEGTMELAEITLEDCFIPENHNHVHQGIVSSEIFDERTYPLSYWLPMFLSLSYWPTILLSKETIREEGRYTSQSPSIGTQKYQQHVFGTKRFNEIKDTDNIELCETMISMINPRRFIRETFWLDIGQALYCADDGGENGLLAWIKHTEKSLKVVGVPAANFMVAAGKLSDTCKNLYHTFASSSITLESIAWYAREDYPDRYADWHENWCIPSMEMSLSGLHSDVVDALHRVYWLEYKYCPKTDRWMHFRNHRWYEMPQALELKTAIRTNFIRRYEAIRMLLSKQTHDSSDDNFKTNAELTIKKITQLIAKLKTAPYKSSIVSEAKEHFKNDKLTSLLDTNPNLTGVTNGVLEVLDKEILFRKAKPEDYISMCTNIPFHAHYSFEHPLVKELMLWFGQIFSEPTLLHYFLKFASSCLKGRNSDKIFSIWTGDGDNSKSMLVKLFEATFHSYCIKFPVSMLTEKNTSSSSPTPQLARAKNTRIAFMDEPEDDVPMNKGTIKRVTGGDSFFARLLQENGADVIATFMLVLMCNKVPMIPNADRAIKNRAKLLSFLNTWTDEDPNAPREGICVDGKMYFKEIPPCGIYKDGKMYFKKNTTFEHRIPFLAPAFLWVMCHYFAYYAEEGLKEPVIVTETTEAYWRDNDVYAQFAADTIQEVYIDTPEGKIRDSNARVTLSEVYSEFKLWFRDTFPGTKVPERTIVRSELSSRWGRINSNSWYGIRIITGDTYSDMTSALGGRKHIPIINKPQSHTLKQTNNIETQSGMLPPNTILI